ncbi:MAG: hypothetical protein LC772_03855, partial [Chloroflexi bacterium]|nr:hypothetical protein [Chloroflexota bacterium]
MDSVCTNFGNCSKADRQDTIRVFQGGEPYCPECGNRVSPIPEPPDRRVRSIIIGVSLVALLLLLGWMLKSFNNGGGDQQSARSTAAKSGATTT